MLRAVHVDRGGGDISVSARLIGHIDVPGNIGRGGVDIVVQEGTYSAAGTAELRVGKAGDDGVHHVHGAAVVEGTCSVAIEGAVDNMHGCKVVDGTVLIGIEDAIGDTKRPTIGLDTDVVRVGQYAVCESDRCSTTSTLEHACLPDGRNRSAAIKHVDKVECGRAVDIDVVPVARSWSCRCSVRVGL